MSHNRLPKGTKEAEQELNHKQKENEEMHPLLNIAKRTFRQLIIDLYFGILSNIGHHCDRPLHSPHPASFGEKVFYSQGYLLLLEGALSIRSQIPLELVERGVRISDVVGDVEVYPALRNWLGVLVQLGLEGAGHTPESFLGTVSRLESLLSVQIGGLHIHTALAGC